MSITRFHQGDLVEDIRNGNMIFITEVNDYVYMYYYIDYPDRELITFVPILQENCKRVKHETT